MEPGNCRAAGILGVQPAYWERNREIAGQPAFWECSWLTTGSAAGNKNGNGKEPGNANRKGNGNYVLRNEYAMKGCRSVWFKTGMISSLLLAAGFLESSELLSLLGAGFVFVCLIGLYTCDDSLNRYKLRKPWSRWHRVRQKHVLDSYCLFIESSTKGLYHDVLDHQALDEMYISAQKELEALFGRKHVWRLTRTQFVVIKKFPEDGAENAFALLPGSLNEEERCIHQQWITESVSRSLSDVIAVYKKETMQMTELTIGTAAAGLRYWPKTLDGLIELAYFTQKKAQEQQLPFLVADEQIRSRKLDIEECKAGFLSAEYDREFNPFFQPIIDPLTSRIVGFESLARWQLGGFRLLEANVFKDLAYEMSLMEEIDTIIMKKAFNAVRELHKEELIPADFRIVLNVTASTLMQVDADQLLLMAEEHMLKPEYIEFDIRDQALSDPQLRDKIQALRSQGFRVALDAFDQQAFDLKAFFYNRFDTLKLDYSHFQLLKNDAVNAAADDKVHDKADDKADDAYAEYSRRLYDSLITMAKNFSIEILAKGIEHRQHLAEAEQAGADHLQGSYFTPAISLADFHTFIKKYQDGIYVEAYSGTSELA
ncbi:MAG: EAL domain-containing protein [Spirochaetia bacterium]|nr:EAL domain-containing protein [Spirochaetia bacterium]